MYFKRPNNRTILLDSFQSRAGSCIIYPFWLPQFIPSCILKTISLLLQYLWYFPQERRIHHALKNNFTHKVANIMLQSFVCVPRHQSYHIHHTTSVLRQFYFPRFDSADWLITWVTEITLETTEYLIAVDPEWINCGNCVIPAAALVSHQWEERPDML